MPLMPTCSRCADNPAAPGHRWCRNCKNMNQAERRVIVARQDFISGFEACRVQAQTVLRGLGFYEQVTGPEAANMLVILRPDFKAEE